MVQVDVTIATVTQLFEIEGSFRGVVIVGVRDRVGEFVGIFGYSPHASRLSPQRFDVGVLWWNGSKSVFDDKA